MKIRHRNLGVTLEIKNILEDYYETPGGSYIHRDEVEWELVKEDEWEDVTSRCEVTNSGVVMLAGRILDCHRYRFVKIEDIRQGPGFIIQERKP